VDAVVLGVGVVLGWGSFGVWCVGVGWCGCWCWCWSLWVVGLGGLGGWGV